MAADIVPDRTDRLEHGTLFRERDWRISKKTKPAQLATVANEDRFDQA